MIVWEGYLYIVLNEASIARISKLVVRVLKTNVDAPVVKVYELLVIPPC